MEKNSEEYITRLLSADEILKSADTLTYRTNSEYDLGCFLKNKSEEPSQYGEKYIFVR